MKDVIGKIGLNLFNDWASIKKRFKFLIDIRFRGTDKLINNIIVASVFPIAGWGCIWIQ